MKNILLASCCILLLSEKSFGQWISESSGFTLQRGIHQIVSPSANVVWATAYNSFYGYAPCRDYCKSTDGGVTWTPATITSAPSGSSWSCISAIDENTAWALFWNNSFSGGTLWKTSDGGGTWIQQGTGVIFTGSTSFPDAIHFWDSDTGVVIGDPVNGEFEIYTTTNGGTTWIPVDTTNIPDPLPGEFSSIRAIVVYNDIIWFGTSSGRAFKSTNRGNTWSVYTVSNDTDIILPVAFENENKGWAVVTGLSNIFHSFLRTLDGGATWTNITSLQNFFEPFVCYVPNTTDILVSSGIHSDNFGVSGSSYSLDGGETWIDIDDSVEHSAIDFFDATTGWSGCVNTNSTTGGMWKFDGNLLTGIAESSANNSFKLYPNPGDGLFYFSYQTENNNPIHLSVTDEIGKIIFDKEYIDQSQTWLRSLDFRRFNKGIYFLRLENDGEEVVRVLMIQ